MAIIDGLLAELEQEAQTTRRVLERIPQAHLTWKPHPKSMPMGYLATLVATMPSWIDTMVTKDELDFAPKGGSDYKAPELRTPRDLVKALEDSVGKARVEEWIEQAVDGPPGLLGPRERIVETESI